ncbi:MAG: carboxypeptidase regulatory-like domain-containing protein [Candidatus Korobacteraceae bacterium]
MHQVCIFGKRWLLLFAAFVVFCGSVFASGPNDGRIFSIALTVLDEKNEPVPDATVEVRSGDKLLGTSATDSSGKINLSLPSVGGYALGVSKKGYLNTGTMIEVSADKPVQDIDVVMSSAALSQQSVTVTAESTNPVTEIQGSQETLPLEQAKISSTRPATLADTLPLIPGIVRAKDGSVRIAGFGEDHSALLVNSVDVTDPATGSFGLSVPIDTVQTVQVSVMPYLAQYGKFTAGVVSADTRRGGDKWDYSLNDPFPDFHIRSGHLEGVADASPRFNLSGPLIKGKLYFVEGVEYLFSNQEVRTLPYPENLTKSTAFNSFTQLDAILTPKQTLTASFHFAPHNLRYTGLDYFNPQPVTPDANFHESTATLTHRWQIGDGLLQSTFAGTAVSSEVWPQANADMVLTPVGNQGNYFSNNSRSATRFAWLERWTPRTLQFHGQHLLQIGSAIEHSENDGGFRGNPVTLQNANGQLLQQIRYVGGKPYHVSDTEPAVYAQDHWILNPHLAVDAGIRLEAQTITSTTKAAPRAGFVWSPGDSGNTVIRGGIGVFYDSVPLDVYAFNSYPNQVITTYNAQGLPVGPPVRYLNITAASANSTFPFIDRNSQSGNFAPYSTAWNIEFERRVKRWLVLRAKYLQSHEQDMITLQPEIIQNQPAFVLSSSGWAQARQAEFTARIGSAAPRQFFFSYVRQYAYGNINDAGSYLGNFPSPVIQPNLVASLPSEIPNRFLLWGTYGNLPKKLTLSPHIEYRNGFPYQPTNVYQQWVPVAGPQSRYPNYFSLDMRVSKDLQVNLQHAVRLSLTVRNLTNHFNALEVHSNLADPQYGKFFGNYDRKFLFDFDFLF